MKSLGLNQRRAVDGDFVAELADFDVADDEDGFVFAQLRFAGGIEQEKTERTEISFSVFSVCSC